jgi:hypothetical protein
LKHTATRCIQRAMGVVTTVCFNMVCFRLISGNCESRMSAELTNPVAAVLS